MKKMLMLMFVAALLAGCNNAGKKSDDATENAEAVAAEWVVVTLNVEGMTCDGCENAIKAGVESLEGIAEVESSFEEGWTKVKYDKALSSVEDIEGKITDAGYTVKGEL